MSRVNVYEGGTLAGWFDAGKARKWSDVDGNGNGSGGTGRGLALYRTAAGKWILSRWTHWQNEQATFEFTTADRAREWLLRNGEDAAAETYFGEIADEEDRRAGRPEIGGRISTAIGDELLAQVDAYATAHETSRAGAVRSLLEDALGCHAQHAAG